MRLENGRIVRLLPERHAGADYQETLDMNRLPKGDYILEIQAGNEILSRKIIKE